MQKIAEPTALTSHLIKVTAPRLAEIRNGRKFGLYGPPVVHATVHDLEGVACLFLVEELHVHVPDHVITEIIGNVQLTVQMIIKIIITINNIGNV